MSSELRELLAHAADEVQDPLDVEDLRRRGRRVERRRRAVMAGGAGVVVVAVATVVLAAIGGLPTRPDVVVEQGPSAGPSVTQPPQTRELVAAAIARSASRTLDVKELADGEEVERLRDVLGDLDVMGTERVLPGRWGSAWHEGGQLVRVAASAAVYPKVGEPFCVLVALAPDGRFAGVPAAGDAYGGCGDVTPQSTADEPLLRGLGGTEPDRGDGVAECNEPSSTTAWGSGGLVEAQPREAGLKAWALLWRDPPWPVGSEVKIVVSLTGSGPLHATAIGPSGRELEPSWGPTAHLESNYDRPGDEWGLAFTPDAPGCWELAIGRDQGSASLQIDVSTAS